MNNVNPKVTVRMSAYNHERYIEQAILSIVNQTYQDFELIVIDDGSKDQTPSILKRLSEEHGFRFEAQENQGYCPTLNKLIGLARGEYITGCASDDYWSSTRLEEQVALLEADLSLDLVHGNHTIVDAAGEVVEQRKKTDTPSLLGRNEYYPLLRRKRSFVAGTIMVRAQVFKDVGLYDTSIDVEDYDWMLRATKICNIGYCDRVWIYRRKHDSNWTVTLKGRQNIRASAAKLRKKLGFWDGLIFWYYGVPRDFNVASIAKSKKRWVYCFLLPLFFLNRAFLGVFYKNIFKRGGAKGV
jgi:alpha-1,3-rhamnosyltransferase